MTLGIFRAFFVVRSHSPLSSLLETLIFAAAQFGYKPDDIVMLTDDASNPRMRPTRDSIINAMQWLVRDARPNDSLFFHCERALSEWVNPLVDLLKDSGHGGQTKDLDGDEADGYDEGQYQASQDDNALIYLFQQSSTRSTTSRTATLWTT
jgi:hypothetical protein